MNGRVVIIAGTEIYGANHEASFSVGETASISCTHGVSAYNGVFWYKQSYGATPEMIIFVYGNSKKGRLAVENDKPSLSTKLSISNVVVEDAGFYQCAASDTVVGSAREAEQKLPKRAA